MKNKNFLEFIPVKNSEFPYYVVGDNKVEILVINKGIFNKLAQVFFNAPQKSRIRLDRYGSFVWSNINGSNTIIDIGERLKDKFGEDSEPLYDRLGKFMKVLNSEKFIKFKKA